MSIKLAGSTDQCSAHLLNEITVSSSTVTIEFALTGPIASSDMPRSICMIDDDDSFTCKSYNGDFDHKLYMHSSMHVI